MLSKESFKSIEPGIREIVRIFYEAGFTTRMSCQGHPERSSNGGLNCGKPYITFNIDKITLEQIDTLKRLVCLSYDTDLYLNLVHRYYPNRNEIGHVYLVEQLILQISHRYDDHVYDINKLEEFLRDNLF